LFPGGKKILELAPQIIISAKALDRKGQPLAMESYDFSPHKLFQEVKLEEYILFLTYSLEYRALVMEQMSHEAEQKYLSTVPSELRTTGYGVILLDFTIRDLKGNLIDIDLWSNFLSISHYQVWDWVTLARTVKS